ncbi:MAG TPA: hypothetical protein VLN90_07670 [Thioalkalivibrio sp.]|nr:hypothetical protein [Thioalkalivibrio sp.]
MQHTTPDPGSRRPPGNRLRPGRFVPIIIIVLIGLFILNQEVPAVNQWVQKLTAPERFSAGEACRRAALNAAQHPGFARLRAAGTVHDTRDGFYVEDVEIGSMDNDGAETVFRFNCYVDREGNVVSRSMVDVDTRP